MPMSSSCAVQRSSCRCCEVLSEDCERGGPCALAVQIVKFNPEVHCWHVGKYGGPDPDHGYRCCDSGEKCGAEVHTNLRF